MLLAKNRPDLVAGVVGLAADPVSFTGSHLAFRFGRFYLLLCRSYVVRFVNLTLLLFPFA